METDNKRFDFKSDLAAELFHGLDLFKVRVPYRAKVQDQLLDYLSISKKIIYPKPREVRYNPEFMARLEQHPKKDVIKHLAQRFREGKDVNSFQSKKLFQSRFHDHLVYEWNIYHFHLSFDRERRGYFRKQVNQLLFALVTDKFVIILGDAGHTRGTFGDVKWLEILHDHFPEIIAPYLSHWKNVYPEFNGVERQQAWDNGLLLGMTAVRDVVYQSPGIGRATSGHSVMVTKQVNEIMRWIYRIEEQLNANYEVICRYLDVDPVAAAFKLRFGKTFEIVEATSGRFVLNCYELFDEGFFN